MDCVFCLAYQGKREPATVISRDLSPACANHSNNFGGLSRHGRSAFHALDSDEAKPYIAALVAKKLKGD